MLVAQLLPLVLATMVQDDIDGGKPALELINPVGQSGQRANNHERSVDLLSPKMAQEANGLHLHSMATRYGRAAHDYMQHQHPYSGQGTATCVLICIKTALHTTCCCKQGARTYCSTGPFQLEKFDIDFLYMRAISGSATW